MIQKSINNTEYWIYNDNPKLPVIIMIHGLRGTHHGLDLIAKQLSEFRVVVPDLPGFGESEPLNGVHSIENYVEWLNRFITDLNLEKPPTLLGHSFGSIIASYFAKKYPNQISKLVLENPIGAPVLKGWHGIQSWIAVAYYQLANILPESIGTRLLSSKAIVLLISASMARTHDKELRKFIHNQHLQYFSTFKNRQVVYEAFMASIGHSVRDVAVNITTPTLLVASEKDNITQVKKQRELAKLFPNAKLNVIQNVGHLTHYETPGEVANEIKIFAR